ncbi:hypothetical protein ACFFX0_09760 [Citricoccus parietis]|uniref:Uncharacterized protein n=1 Tax=Citricoccus parietis TaxID=592307 RepID=A0ABV5FXV6_9MICC
MRRPRESGQRRRRRRPREHGGYEECVVRQRRRWQREPPWSGQRCGRAGVMWSWAAL